MVDYKDLLNTEPLGSIERLYLILRNGNLEQSKAAERCINKRLNKEYKSKNKRSPQNGKCE